MGPLYTSKVTQKATMTGHTPWERSHRIGWYFTIGITAYVFGNTIFHKDSVSGVGGKVNTLAGEF